MDDLIEFLRARLDEDALWATEASRREDGPAVEGGVHWRWEDPETDHHVEVNPGQDEFVGGDSYCVSLRSQEEWPTASGLGSLPQFALREVEEVPSAVGGHIARHDPARVLAEVEAKRRLLRHYESAVTSLRNTVPGDDLHHLMTGAVNTLRAVLADHAAVYADDPSYREEWRS